LLIPVQLIPIMEFWSIRIISGSHWRCILFTVSGHSIDRSEAKSEGYMDVRHRIQAAELFSPGTQETAF
jgi:hypothetical protein